MNHDEQFASALAGDTSYLLNGTDRQLWLAAFVSHAAREEAGPRGLAALVGNSIFMDDQGALIVRTGAAARQGGLADVLMLVEPEEGRAFEHVVRELSDQPEHMTFTRAVGMLIEAAKGMVPALSALHGRSDAVLKLPPNKVHAVWPQYTSMWNDQRENLARMKEAALLLPQMGADTAAEVKAKVLAYYAVLLARQEALVRQCEANSRLRIVNAEQ